MSNGARIALRLLGFVFLLVGLVGIVLLFVPGPSDVADWMGKSCAHSENGPGEACTTSDIREILFGAPTVALIGGAIALALRPEDKGPMTLEFSGRGGGS